MIKIDLLDYGVYLDGNHVADFDNEEEARRFAYSRVLADTAKGATVINNFTGEIICTVYEYLSREVRVES